MTKARKLLGMFLVALFTISTCLSAAPVQAAVKKPATPKLVLVAQPKAEYNVGERVTIQVKAPNYSGKVQYRAILWDGNKKVQRELWPTMPGYYYTKWIPTGPTTFTIGWPIMEPGPYSLTILVKRNGAKVPYDSYVKTISFVVKEKEVAVSKDVTLDKAGQTYGPDDSSKPETIEKDLYIKADNVTLRNVVVKGTVFVDPGKDGSTNLENVTAKNIKVLSGGQNSIHIKNVKAQGMDVDSSSPVRIEADGDTEIVATTANGYVIFDKKNGTYGTITITTNENGENVIEFRGDIKDKVVVEAAAEIKTTEGSIENLEIATEKKEDVVTIQGTVKSVEVNKEATVKAAAGSKIEEMKVNTAAKIVADKDAEVGKVAISTQKKEEVVNLEGTIKTVEVNKEATVQIASGTKIENVVVNTEATINVEQGATVENLNANGNKVVLDNKGTVEKKENAGNVVTPQPQQPPVVIIPTPTPTVYTENDNLNAAITNVVNTLLGYGIVNDVFDVTPHFANSSGTSTINVKIANQYSGLTVESTALLAKNRAANRTLNASNSNDIASMTALRATLTNIRVGNKTLSLYVADMLQTKGTAPNLEAFLRTIDSSADITNCIVAYNGMLPTLSTYDYDDMLNLIKSLLVNGELSIPNMTTYGLTLVKIGVGDADTAIYEGNDTTISLSDVRNILGVQADKTVGETVINALVPKKVSLTFRGASGAVYKYELTLTIQ